MEIDVSKQIFNKIIQEAQRQVEICNEFSKVHISESFPELIEDV